MAIFSRRRLQGMLYDLSGHLSAKKAKEFRGSLNKQDNPSTLMAAEYELGLLWAISRCAKIEIEPTISNSNRKPDVFSPDLFLKPTFIEITTISDYKMSGEDLMEKAAKKIVEYANLVNSESGEFLYFQFYEESLWENGRDKRNLLVTDGFELDNANKVQLQNWLSSSPSPDDNLPLVQNDKKIVSVIKKGCRQDKMSNFYTTRPAGPYDLEDNSIFESLIKKQNQLSFPVNKKFLSFTISRKFKCVLLGDAGCRPLRNLAYHSISISGEEAIRHFLSRPDSDIDCVCVFTSYRCPSSYVTSSQELSWTIIPFYRSGIDETAFQPGLCALEAKLPKPLFEGYRARTIIRGYAGFRPQGHGWYLTTVITLFKGGNEIIKLSARLVQEYFAGRVTKERFENLAFGNLPNPFELRLKEGLTIRDGGVESGGIDEDDDYLVFEVASDSVATITGPKGGNEIIKLSARLVQKYFAGRVTKERFEKFAFGNLPNPFELRLKKGWTICDFGVESWGIGEDDNSLVFELEPDPAASPFKLSQE